MYEWTMSPTEAYELTLFKNTSDKSARPVLVEQSLQWWLQRYSFNVHLSIHSLPLLRVCHISTSLNQDKMLCIVLWAVLHSVQHLLKSPRILFSTLICAKGHVKKNLFCVWGKCARIPDNTEHVTWQFPCLNLMRCQADWNGSIRGETLNYSFR